jgi:26S proteasome regulatory subunit N2
MKLYIKLTLLDWVAKANLWNKFSVTASLGTIHQGNTAKAMEILTPYFPNSSPTPSWYTHGGSLYALGLIHAGDRDQKVIEHILSNIKNPTFNQNENFVHGAALGLGLVNLGSSAEEDNVVIYEELKNILFTDSATTGEAAGLAIGLTMVGSANQMVIDDLLGYAHETQHEKIIRSISLALALIMYGKEESADTLIETLCQDKDPIIRFGGMYMIGLAYVATSSNYALKKLLHFAVSDVSNDVRRAAVTNIGFLMLKDFTQV